MITGQRSASIFRIQSNSSGMTNSRIDQPAIRRWQFICSPLGLALAILLTVAEPCHAAPPTLNSLFPAGGQRGSKVTVTCDGSFTWPVNIWAQGIEAACTADSGKIEVSIPEDLATDRIWIRLYDAEGASVSAPFMIGSLQELQEIEPNDRPNEAQPIEVLPVILNGALKKAEVDSFAVHLSAGQTLVAALDANTRIGSPMDAILQVVSPQGIVLAENHDDLKLDPRLPFTAPREGTYVVRLFAFPSTPDSSIQFNGGANHIYRLTLTTGPLATHTIPLSVPLQNPGQVSAAGWNLAQLPMLDVVPLGGTRLTGLMEFEASDELRRSPEARFGYAFAPGFSAAARVRLSPYETVTEPAIRTTNEPIPTVIPSSITGCLSRPKIANSYSIALSKGQQVLFSVESRSLDLPLDPVLKLVDPMGNVVADVDDSGPTRDAIIAHTASHDGIYQLTVSDRFRQGGERCWYLLTVRFEQADFELSLASSEIVVAADKPTELPVKIVRRANGSEAIGPITLEVQGLPASVTAAAVVSETSGPSASEVKLSLASSGDEFSGPIRIVGKATQPAEIERSARTPVRLGIQFDAIWLTATKKP